MPAFPIIHPFGQEYRKTVVHPLDVAVVVVYVAATIFLGVWLARGQRDRVDYFLGRHELPTWALLLSIVATETSTVTFLSVPGKAFDSGGNFFFLQLAIGYVVGRLIVVAMLLPHYFRGEQMTAYAVLEQRFGTGTRKVASVIFLLARTVGDGLRLYLAAKAIQIAMGLSLETSVLLVAGATAIYAFSGGVKSVVWNDVLQFFVYMAGGIVILLVIVGRLPGGAGQVWDFAVSTERMQLFDFKWSDPRHLTFWPGLLGGAFLSLATHGADQLIVQRYLCARDQRSASLALGWSGPIVLLQFTLFLIIGVAIACYFTEFDPTRFLVEGKPIKGDEALLSFVARDLYPGLSGLVLAAICAAAMSTLSSSVNSSASSLLDDLFASWTLRQSDAASLWAARLMTLVFTAAQAAIALAAEYAIRDQSVVDQVLAIAGFAAGLLLGLYFLGLVVGKAPTWVALVSLVVGTSINLLVTYLEWNTYWFSFTGSMATLACGLLLVFSIRAMTRPGLER